METEMRWRKIRVLAMSLFFVGMMVFIYSIWLYIDGSIHETGLYDASELMALYFTVVTILWASAFIISFRVEYEIALSSRERATPLGNIDVKFCPYCGTQAIGTKHCSGCGQQVRP